MVSLGSGIWSDRWIHLDLFCFQVGNVCVLDLTLQEEACSGATLHVAVGQMLHCIAASSPL